MIAEKYQLNEDTALRMFINSQTYQLLFDDTTKLFRESPLVIFDLFKAEQETSNALNSSYIKDYE